MRKARTRISAWSHMKTLKFNGTVRYNKLLARYQTSCEICGDGPKGTWGQAFASEASTKGRAQAGLGTHIRRIHGVEPVIRIGAPVC